MTKELLFLITNLSGRLSLHTLSPCPTTQPSASSTQKGAAGSSRLSRARGGALFVVEPRRDVRPARVSDECVEESRRVRVSTVVVEAEGGDEQAARASARLHGERLVTVEPAVGDA